MAAEIDLADACVRQMRAFICVVKGAIAELATLDEAMAVVAPCDAARLASSAGGAVPVEHQRGNSWTR